MRVRFPTGEQQAFLLEVQQQTGQAAKNLASQIGVCARTFRDWQREKWQMDEQSLSRLCQLAELPRPQNVTILPEHWSVHKAATLGGLQRAASHRLPGTQESRRRGGLAIQAWIRQNPELARKKGIVVRKIIRIPEPGEQLAEFIGIFLGDGGFRNGWQITISFNYRADVAYARFLISFIKELFNLDVKYSIRPGESGDIVISSTALVEFLEQQLGVTRGRKSAVITHIPEWIVSQELHRIACLRGLMDTDGCVYQHRYRVNGTWYAYVKMGFAGVIPPICQFVEESLNKLGIPAHRRQSGQRVFIDSTKAVRKYFTVVGTHNPRYWRRFQKFSGEVAKRPYGGGLLNRCTGENPYRGFESLPLRFSICAQPKEA